MTKQPRHRPSRKFENAKRLILECELEACPHCGEALKPCNTWHMRQTVQALVGPVFIGGKTKACVHEKCSHPGQYYYASQATLISLPKRTSGLDFLAYIGWQHEHEHQQLVEIQRELNAREILINERHTGKLYRQFLAFLGALSARTGEKLEKVVAEHGGLIWSVAALQPEGHGTWLYVMYEVLSNTPVAAIQLEHAKTDKLVEWLAPYKELPYAVLATLSDGEPAIIEALEICWPKAPRQRCHGVPIFAGGPFSEQLGRSSPNL